MTSPRTRLKAASSPSVPPARPAGSERATTDGGERAQHGGRGATGWLREPLIQFVAIGLVLFAASAVFHPDAAAPPPSHRIELTLDDLLQLQIAFTSQWQRPPTPPEMAGLVENKVREEILYREALALGLDKNDTIVKRRMAQKMEFLAEDVSDAREPAAGELERWFAEHTDQFAQPGRVTFRHLYFSPDTRGAHAQEGAAAVLAKLAGMPGDSPAAKTLADRFMFQSYLADRSPEQLAKDFGPRFARSLFELQPGSWQGPIESGYGWHLVFVESSTPGRVPAFEEVETDVRTAWKADQHAEAWRKAYEGMRAKYELVLPAPPATDTRDGAGSEPKDGP